MHRTDILNELLKRGVHVGNDQDSRKQLASLSSTMSSDPRFAPVAGRLGCWKLATLTDDIASESLGDSSDTPPMLRHLNNAHTEQAEDVQYQDSIAS